MESNVRYREAQWARDIPWAIYAADLLPDSDGDSEPPTTSSVSSRERLNFYNAKEDKSSVAGDDGNSAVMSYSCNGDFEDTRLSDGGSFEEPWSHGRFVIEI
jgi:hypothetical protein